MVTNTAKLQEKIMALTNIDGSGGVDILTETGDFKSTYDILLAISKVWKDMGDVEQAALLELVAGKTRGSVVAALFQNGDVLENAYNSAMGASGSAMQELENHLDSIQGRIDLFNNALQTMWMNFINADVVKFFVDIGTAAIKLVDTLGVIPTAAGVFSAYKFAANDLKQVFDGTSVSTKQVRKELHEYLTAQKEGISTSNAVKNSKIEEAAATNTSAVADAKEAGTSIANAEANIQQAQASNQVQKEKIEEVAANNKSATEDVKEAGSSLTGFVTKAGSALGKVGSALGKVGVVVGTLIKSFSKAALVLLAVQVASKILSSVWTAIDNAHQTTDELLEEWENVQIEIEKINDELKTTQSRIAELEAQGVLSFTDKEELTLLRQQNDELERRLRLEQANADTAKNEAQASVKSDYEKNFISDTIVTNAAKKELNQVQGIISALEAFKATPDFNVFDSLEQWQKDALQSAAPDLYSYISTTTYNALDSTTQQAIHDIQVQYDKRLEELIRATTEGTLVSGETHIDQAIQKIQEYKEELYDSNGRLKEGLDDQYVVDVAANIDALESDLLSVASELYTYLDNYGGDASDPFVQNIQKQLEKIDMTINPVEFYNKKFDEIFGKYSDEKRALYELAEQGRLTANILNDSTYAPLMREMMQLGITADDVAEHINSLSDAALAKVTNLEFNITDYTSDIKSHSAVISEFQDAIMKLGKGSFTMDDFLDLVERFPDLAKGVDISSNAFYGLSRNLNKAIKSRTKDFIRDLQNLRKSMVAAGKETDSIDQLIEAIENMPDDALDDTIEKYSTLADAIERSRVAQDKLLASMEENPNQGYETRGEALEYMKDAMSKGEIGSESNLWNVAKQYGFTYDSAKSINENADALAKYIAVREKWWKQADDGDDRTKDGYSFEGTENFIQSVEEAVDANARLQQILKWDYDETTGTLDFDFDNEDLPEIISLLSGMKDLVGLTQDEWMDLMVQVGQFFDIKWGDADDVSDYITKIAEGSGTAADKIEQMTDSVEVYVEKALGKDIDFSTLTEAGIEAITTDEKIRELLRTYLSLKESLDDPLNIETKIEESETIEPLLEIKELQSAITKGSYNYTIVNTDTFTSVLTAAGYTEDQIDDLIKKVKEYQGVVTITNNDPLGLNSQNASATTVMSSLKQLGVEYELIRGELGTPAQINITAKDLITTLQEKGWTQPKIAEYIATLTSTENGLGITVDGKVNMTTDQVDAAITEINNAPKDVNTTVNVDYSQFTSYQEAFEAYNGRTITNTVYIDEIHREYDAKSGSYTTISGDGKVGVNGTAHAQGTAYSSGSWGAEATETSLVGELGPELLVRGNRWTTVGENGAEFTQVKKGDIIFNHKQTESLLKNGYVTGRGKAYASGTAFASGGGTFGRYEFSGEGGYVKYDVNDEIVDRFGDAADSLSGAGDSLSDATDEFKEVFDWIEVRLEELEETLGLLNAQLENATYYSQKNNIIDDIIAVNKTKLKNLNDGYAEYSRYAAELLSEIPEQYRDAAQNGAIAIEKFVGEADEKTLEAIQNYREWIQKAADLNQQAEEIITTIRDLAIQKFDNAYEAGDVRATVEDSQTEKLQNAVDYDEERGLITSDAYYLAMMENSNKKIEYLTEARKAMQAELDAAVEAGQIERGSNEWYELLDQMYQIDAQIDEATIELEEFQNAINDIYWENFDQLINRIDYIKDETQNLIDLMDSEDMVVDPVKRTYEGGTVEYWTADDVEWSKEGLASLGLYAQQMEIAEYKAKQYAKAIDDLNKDYADGKYSENEYYEKLNELKDAQYESIEAYYDAQDAIKDLNQTRIDSIKKGIEKEIEAYEELIDKKKEALDADKDAHDFQKSIQESQKNIDDIQRKLDALYGDNSASARARRAQLEAELAKARQEQEELYYDRSIEDQQNALDKELENFQKEKDDEITKMEEYLEDIKQVVADSLTIVQDNASGIYDTLSEKAAEYDLTLSDAIMSPWQDGSLAVSGYQETFDTAMSSTMDQLEALKNKWQEVIDKMIEAGNVNVENINKENEDYAAATYTEPVTPPTSADTGTEQGQEQEIAIGSTIDAGDAPIYADSNGGGKSTQYYKEHPIYKVVDLQGDYALVRHDSLVTGVTGWFRKNQIKAFAKGTKSADKDQWSIIDELGDELRLIPDGNGRLAYMKKGTGVVPADLTTNLMEWGKLDPTNMLEQNRPQIGVSPSVVNNTTEIHIDASVGELLHVEHLEGNNPVEISKIVDKAWDKRMKELNGYLRRYTNR